MVGDRRAIVALARVALCVAVGLASFACNGRSRPRGLTGDAAGDDLDTRLHAFSESKRQNVDFSAVKSWNEIAGADPIRIAVVAGRSVALLRNAQAIVVLDERLHEIQRLPAPRSATGLAVSGDDVFVCGELSSRIERYRMKDARLWITGALDVPNVAGLRDVAAGPEGMLYVADEHDGKTIALHVPDAAWSSGIGFEKRESIGKMAPFRIARVGSYVIVDDLLAHTLAITPVDARGFPEPAHEITIRHDGPIWSFAAEPTADGLVVAAGGVEDHPLDRSGGFFGNVDSFVFVYRVRGDRAERIAEQNVSELGVVTPKALALHVDASRISLLVTGYGSDHATRVVWNATDLAHPEIFTIAVPPGIAALAETSPTSFVFANPLLDAFGVVRDHDLGVQLSVVDQGAAPRSVSSRIGEALFFTTLMAPNDTAEGTHSRFTCETCHFEGYGDGRTHFTGREDVHATTKPLRGLANNRPHFSRALDPDLATVSMNEFRVASAGSGVSEEFDVSTADFPWIRDLGVDGESVDEETLRRSLIDFLSDFSHLPNPAVIGRSRFDDSERRGAELFRDHCETCHEARFVSDDAATRVPFARWEAAIFSERGAIVWARATYEKTGVVPYVHELGARVPSLRRLAKKRPYFTNGTAPDLATVLDRARFSGSSFFHDAAPATATSLTPEEQKHVLDFLKLL